jgi:predicted alpha/beta-fold hydrolase
MTIETQLLSFKTSDKETLHGLLFTPPERKSDLALLLVHGVAMNFYLPPLPTIGQALADRGYHCFVINTRGHDWISRACNLTKFGGATYETFEDSAKDFDGALDYLSAGGIQALHPRRPQPRLRKIIALSRQPPATRYRRRRLLFLPQTVLLRARRGTAGV